MKKGSELVLLVFLAYCVAIMGSTRFEANGSVNIRVLHISTNLQNEVQRIIENVSKANIFTVTQLSLFDFNNGAPADLSQYDVIVFGINDGGESRGPYSGSYGRTSEMKNFVESGGGIVWTHDTLEYVGNYGANIEGPAGVENSGAAPHPTPYADVEYVRIMRDHNLLHEPFEIGNPGDLIPKTLSAAGSYDHTTGGWVTTATILIEHAAPSTPYNFYLTVNNYGQGRVAVIELGHSMGDYGIDLESTRENQILVNVLCWASGVHLEADLTVTSLPITGISFTINGLAKTTPYVDILQQGLYSLEMPETYNGYRFSNWLEDGDTNRIKSITLKGDPTWTAVYVLASPPTPLVGGEWIPTNKLRLFAPLIVMASLITALTVSFVYVRRKRQQN